MDSSCERAEENTGSFEQLSAERGSEGHPRTSSAHEKEGRCSQLEGGNSDKAGVGCGGEHHHASGDTCCLGKKITDLLESGRVRRYDVDFHGDIAECDAGESGGRNELEDVGGECYPSIFPAKAQDGGTRERGGGTQLQEEALYHCEKAPDDSYNEWQRGARRQLVEEAGVTRASHLCVEGGGTLDGQAVNDCASSKDKNSVGQCRHGRAGMERNDKGQAEMQEEEGQGVRGGLAIGGQRHDLNDHDASEEAVDKRNQDHVDADVFEGGVVDEYDEEALPAQVGEFASQALLFGWGKEVKRSRVEDQNDQEHNDDISEGPRRVGGRRSHDEDRSQRMRDDDVSDGPHGNQSEGDREEDLCERVQDDEIGQGVQIDNGVEFREDDQDDGLLDDNVCDGLEEHSSAEMREDHQNELVRDGKSQCLQERFGEGMRENVSQQGQGDGCDSNDGLESDSRGAEEWIALAGDIKSLLVSKVSRENERITILQSEVFEMEMDVSGEEEWEKIKRWEEIKLSDKGIEARHARRKQHESEEVELEEASCKAEADRLKAEYKAAMIRDQAPRSQQHAIKERPQRASPVPLFKQTHGYDAGQEENLLSPSSATRRDLQAHAFYPSLEVMLHMDASPFTPCVDAFPETPCSVAFHHVTPSPERHLHATTSYHETTISEAHYCVDSQPTSAAGIKPDSTSLCTQSRLADLHAPRPEFALSADEAPEADFATASLHSFPEDLYTEAQEFTPSAPEASKSSIAAFSPLSLHGECHQKTQEPTLPSAANLKPVAKFVSDSMSPRRHHTGALESTTPLAANHQPASEIVSDTTSSWKVNTDASATPYAPNSILLYPDVLAAEEKAIIRFQQSSQIVASNFAANYMAASAQNKSHPEFQPIIFASDAAVANRPERITQIRPKKKALLPSPASSNAEESTSPLLSKAGAMGLVTAADLVSSNRQSTDAMCRHGLLCRLAFCPFMHPEGYKEARSRRARQFAEAPSEAGFHCKRKDLSAAQGYLCVASPSALMHNTTLSAHMCSLIFGCMLPVSGLSLCTDLS